MTRNHKLGWFKQAELYCLKFLEAAPGHGVWGDSRGETSLLLPSFSCFLAIVGISWLIAAWCSSHMSIFMSKFPSCHKDTSHALEPNSIQYEFILTWLYLQGPIPKGHIHIYQELRLKHIFWGKTIKFIIVSIIETCLFQQLVLLALAHTRLTLVPTENNFLQETPPNFLPPSPEHGLRSQRSLHIALNFPYYGTFRAVMWCPVYLVK